MHDLRGHVQTLAILLAALIAADFAARSFRGLEGLLLEEAA
jgi:hypothetical protein